MKISYKFENLCLQTDKENRLFIVLKWIWNIKEFGSTASFSGSLGNKKGPNKIHASGSLLYKTSAVLFMFNSKST